MDNKKKTDSIMRYVVYLLCGVLLAGCIMGVVSLLGFSAFGAIAG